jgi:hypothetical protein
LTFLSLPHKDFDGYPKDAVKQAQLNAALDLDKHEAQVVAETPEAPERAVAPSFAVRVMIEDRAVAVAP